MSRILALAVLLALGGFQSAARPIHLFIFAEAPADTGFVTVDSKALVDSANDLKPHLAGKKGRIYLDQVDARSEADVSVQVTGREQDPHDSDNRIVHLRVTVKDYVVTIDGKNDDGSWRDAAKDAAKQLVKWMELNQARIVPPRKIG